MAHSSTPVKVGNEATKYPSIYDLPRVLGQNTRQISQELNLNVNKCVNLAFVVFFFMLACFSSAETYGQGREDQRSQVKVQTSSHIGHQRMTSPGSSQFWHCQDFESAYFAHPSLTQLFIQSSIKKSKRCFKEPTKLSGGQWKTSLGDQKKLSAVCKKWLLSKKNGHAVMSV